LTGARGGLGWLRGEGRRVDARSSAALGAARVAEEVSTRGV